MAESNTNCIKCKKVIINQNCICCDSCDGWIHLKCVKGLTRKEFDKLGENNEEFNCIFCQKYKCGKCDNPVYPHQNAIQCDSEQCAKWHHLRCTPFTHAEYADKKSRLHTENWYCIKCSCLPFNELPQSDFMKLQTDDKKLKEYFNFITCNEQYCNTCTVCNRSVKKSQTKKSFPCKMCKSYIHRSCTGIPLSEMLQGKPNQFKYWSCKTCNEHIFPFAEMDDANLTKISFNNGIDCPCNDRTESIPLENCTTFKLVEPFLPKDSPFSIGPDPNIDLTYDINAKCNYTSLHDFHKLTTKFKDKINKPFTALHTNIESLTHNFDALENLCTDLDYPLDVIAVTETWNSDKKKNSFIPKILPGYETYKGLRGTTLKSGCGLYVRSGLTYVERKDLDIQFYNDLNEFQMKFVEMIVPKGANIILSVTYRHPKRNSDGTFNSKLKELLEKVTSEHKILMFLGDFNYNLLNHDKDLHTKDFIEIMYSNSLQPTINKPTRVVDRHKPSLLDNIFTNAIDKDITTGNLTDKITDHMPNFIIMKNLSFEHKKVSRKARCFKKFDLESYLHDIDSIDLAPKLAQTTDVNEVYKYYQEQIINVINKHAPFITLTNKQLEWKKKPWISKRLQILIAEKNTLYRKTLEKRGDDFWISRYKCLKKNLEKQLFRAKKEFFVKYFELNLHNSRKIWKGINEIIHNKSNRNNAEIYLDENGTILTDQKTVANRFNKFYTNVAGNLLKNLGESPTKFQDYLKNPNEHSIFLAETDPDEIEEIILKLDITKSGDIYGITPKLVKYAPCIAKNLSTILNLAIQQGIFPHQLRIAKVIPIHKGDSKMIVSNYRPISLLPIFGKIFEKIIFKRLTAFILKHNILYEKQYGFQTGKSTEHAIIDIQHQILEALEKKEHPCCVFLDFAKAFDTVNHNILLSKLYHYGIRGTPLQLIKSYLTDREQCVQVNNAISDFNKITHGVPQGSILGPLFFLLYINDIALSSPMLSFYLFADDTTIFLSDKNVKNLEEILNRELVNVSHWLVANKLSLNVKKSNVLLFRTKNNKNTLNINLMLNGIPIEEKLEAKYLGVTYQTGTIKTDQGKCHTCQGPTFPASFSSYQHVQCSYTTSH